MIETMDTAQKYDTIFDKFQNLNALADKIMEQTVLMYREIIGVMPQDSEEQPQYKGSGLINDVRENIAILEIKLGHIQSDLSSLLIAISRETDKSIGK